MIAGKADSFKRESMKSGGLDPLTLAHYSAVINDGGQFHFGFTLYQLDEDIKQLQRLWGKNLQNLVSCYALNKFGFQLGLGSGTSSGRAVSKIYSLLGRDFDAIQETANAQPLLLQYLGRKFLFVDQGSQGVSTAQAAKFNITGDIDFDWEIKTGSITTIYGWEKTDGVTQNYGSYITTSGTIVFRFYNGLSLETISSSTGAPIAINQDISIRITRESISGDVNFYYSIDQGENWVKVGATVPSTSGDLIPLNSSLYLGRTAGGSGSAFYRHYYQGNLYNGIRENGGLLVARFDAEDFDISNSQTTLTNSLSSVVWSINVSTSATGYKTQLVYETVCLTDGLDDVIRTATFSSYLENTIYIVGSKSSTSGVQGFVSFQQSASTTFYGILNNGNGQARLGSTNNGLNINGWTVNRIQVHTWSKANSSNYADHDYRINDSDSKGANLGATDNAPLNALQVGLWANTYGSMTFSACIISKQIDSTEIKSAACSMLRSWNGNPKI